MLPLFSIRVAENDNLPGKELFSRFTVRVFRESLSIFVCPSSCSFPFGFEDEMWVLLVEAPPSNVIAGRPMAALLFWFFAGFRCGVPLFIVMLFVY